MLLLMHSSPYAWTHNNHYYDRLLSAVPPDCSSALDIGCGFGEFAIRLSALSVTVDAIDSDDKTIAVARGYGSRYHNVTFNHQPFEEANLSQDTYDFVSAIAALHHMDLTSTLLKMKRVLRPGGVLAILGCFRESSVDDYAWAALAVPVNLLCRLHKHTSRTAKTPHMIVRDPEQTLRELRQQFDRILPNHRFRRHLLWRYSVIWEKPLRTAPN